MKKYKNTNNEIYAYEDDISKELLNQRIKELGLTPISDDEAKKLLEPKIDELTTKLALKEANNTVVKADLDTCKAKIELVNVSLKALSVPKQDEANIKERVITKIERVAVPIKDAACEEKLNFYERLLNEAGNK